MVSQLVQIGGIDEVVGAAWFKRAKDEAFSLEGHSCSKSTLVVLLLPLPLPPPEAICCKCLGRCMACSLRYSPQALHRGSLLAERRHKGVMVAAQLWQWTPMPAAALIVALEGLRALVILMVLSPMVRGRKGDEGVFGGWGAWVWGIEVVGAKVVGTGGIEVGAIVVMGGDKAGSCVVIVDDTGNPSLSPEEVAIPWGCWKWGLR